MCIRDRRFVAQAAKKSVPGVDLRASIRNFAGVRAVTNLLLPLSREGNVRIYSARELEELLSTAFHGAECRRVSPTALVAWGVK